MDYFWIVMFGGVQIAFAILSLMLGDNIKSTTNENHSSFVHEFKRLTKRHKFVIFLAFMSGCGSTFYGILALQEKHDQEIVDAKKHIEDSLRRHSDSLQIVYLLQIMDKQNVSDSVLFKVDSSSIKEIEVQMKIQEAKMQNAFLNMRNEVILNLRIIHIEYQEERINECRNVRGFVVRGLGYENIDGYRELSVNDRIIDHFLQTSESIEKINKQINFIHFLDGIKDSLRWSKAKNNAIDDFQKYIEWTQEDLYSIFENIYKLENFKLYETMVFDDKIPSYDSLEQVLLKDLKIRSWDDE